jgi:hypothetical protein
MLYFMIVMFANFSSQKKILLIPNIIRGWALDFVEVHAVIESKSGEARKSRFDAPHLASPKRTR